MPPSPVRSLVVSSYGRILRALYSKQGLPWQVHDEVVRIDPDVRHGEELFARDTHAGPGFALVAAGARLRFHGSRAMSGPAGDSFGEDAVGANRRGAARGRPVRGTAPRVQAALRMLSAGGGGLRSVLPGGEVVLVSPAFRHVTWNRDEYKAFRAAVRPGDVVLEAGSNVGAYTMLFARWAGADGRVFAFEPDPMAYAGCSSTRAQRPRRSRDACGCRSRGRPRGGLRFALGASSGISRLVQPEKRRR